MTTEPIEATRLSHFQSTHDFIHRHIGPSPDEIEAMLETVNANSLDELIESTVPSSILLDRELDLPCSSTEVKAVGQLKQFSQENIVNRSMIGMGYYGTFVPNVILRNVLENPGWYTAYTPYQAEISQGRLESLLSFQQMIMDLTGMEMANASLLDEATAAAEAMTLCKRASKLPVNNFFVADDVHPQTLEVVRTRAEYFGFEVIFGPADEVGNHQVFGALLQYPGTTGQVRDLSSLIETIHQQKALVAVASDLLSLTLLKPPGEMGADIVLGSAQRFGVPMGFGGPHAAFFATRDAFKRSAPGRIIGVSRDSRGKTALRMAMQTREQHIRRDKATSNICTAQALLANMAAFYAIYHGPKRLTTIATRIHLMARWAAAQLREAGFQIEFDYFFDTVSVMTHAAEKIVHRAADEFGLNLRLIAIDQVGFSFDETTSFDDLSALLSSFGVETVEIDPEAPMDGVETSIPPEVQRTTKFLTHPVFTRKRRCCVISNDSKIEIFL